MSKELAVLYQQQFDTNIPLTLAEIKGGKFRGYCRMGDGLNTDAYTFYADEGYHTDDNAPQAYNNSTYAGTSGDRKSYTVSPRSVYAHELLPWERMQSTSLKADSNFMRGFKNALQIKEDIEIIKAIEAEDASLIANGDNTGAVNTDANLVTFKNNCVLAVANADSGSVVDGVGTVAVMMDTRDYADLLSKGTGEGATISSADFKVLQNANGILVNHMFGCDIITYKKFKDATKWGDRVGVVPQGTIYFMPAKTVGFVYWAGSEFSHSEYQPGNADSMFFMVRASMGAIGIEPDSIIKMSVLEK